MTTGLKLQFQDIGRVELSIDVIIASFVLVLFVVVDCLSPQRPVVVLNVQFVPELVLYYDLPWHRVVIGW